MVAVALALAAPTIGRADVKVGDVFPVLASASLVPLAGGPVTTTRDFVPIRRSRNAPTGTSLHAARARSVALVTSGTKSTTE